MGCPEGEYVTTTATETFSTDHLLIHQLRSPTQVQERLDRLISKIKKIQEPFMDGGTAPDILVVAHGHILRAFTKRWMEWDLGFAFTMMMEPGAIGVLSYAHHSITEPAVLIGMAFPSTE